MPSDLKDADAAEHGTKCKSPGGIIKSRTKLSKTASKLATNGSCSTKATNNTQLHSPRAKDEQGASVHLGGLSHAPF